MERLVRGYKGKEKSERGEGPKLRQKKTQVSGGETWVEGGFSDVPHTWYDSIMVRKEKLYTFY